ncbi:hypothetical protein FGIG_03100 [Fasciola gigantica]|uniref:Nephrocystin-4 n=1 Tax=Fasciola gigantica TaxID=46835 RepID=A0A504YKB9_FASGI|nr:hypothetical protein FGIG_03100 [Fasciola gigantica]
MPDGWAPYFVDQQNEEVEEEETINYVRIILDHIDVPTNQVVLNDTVWYKLSLYFFDPINRSVLGRIWRSDVLRSRKTTDGQIGCILHDTVYLYSSDIQKMHFIVFELDSYEKDGGNLGSAVCWGAENVAEFLSDVKGSHKRTTPVYSGPSRAIYAFGDPMSLKGFPPTKCAIYYSFEFYPPLEKCAGLMPENTPLSASRRIPGIMVPSGLKFGVQDKTTTVHLYNLSVKINPLQLDQFEREFCESVRENIVQRGGRSKISFTGMPQISERRLKIFYHNRYRPVEPIPLVLLDLCSEDDEHTLRRRRSCAPSPSRHASVFEESGESKTVSKENFSLLARNPVQLKMPRDPECSVVFVLEYIISDRGSEIQRRASSVTSVIKASFTVRWGVYQPFLDETITSREQFRGSFQATLRGTVPDEGTYPLGLYNLEQKMAEHLCPNGTFCFRNDTKFGLNFVLTGEVCIGTEISQIRDTGLVTQSKVDQVDTQIEAQAVYNLNQAPTQPSIAAHMVENQSRISPEKASLIESATNLLQPYSIPSNEVLAQQTFYSQMAQQRSRSPSFTQFMGPFLGGQGPAVYEPMQSVPAIPYAQLTRGVGGPISLVAHSHRGVGLSRAAYARLYRAGFTQVSTESGDPPVIVNPEDEVDPVRSFSLKKEAADVRSVNEIVMQILAYSCCTEPSTQISTKNGVYFTFQFYRFPQIVTQKLSFGQMLDDFSDVEGLRCYVLEQITGDASKTLGKGTGYQIVITLDPTFMKPGEYETFFSYLLNDNLHIDIWDACSHMLIGSSAVELKHLCRQGREAVQVTYVLDVLPPSDDSEALLSDPPSIRGLVHLRLANVGRHSSTPSAAITVFNRRQRRFLIAADDKSTGFGFEGGALSSACLPIASRVQRSLGTIGAESECRLVRARPLIEVSPELYEMLRIARTERQAHEQTVFTQSSRQRKLNRLYTALQAVNRSLFINDLAGYTTLSGVKISGTDKALELNTICNYREQKKKEQIERMLSRAQIIEHCLETSFGCTEFLEFQLTNPNNHEETVRIDIEDNENSTVLLTDVRETKTLKATLGIITPTEDDLFVDDLTVSRDGSIQGNRSHVAIFLKPKESVLIPLKYMETRMLKKQMKVDGTQKNITGDAFQEEHRVVQVNFKSTTTGKLLSQLILRIHINPAVIDQTFQFFHPELSYLKKLIRLPSLVARNVHSPYGTLNTDQTGPVSQVGGLVWTRVSDPGVLAESGSVNAGEPTDLLVKVSIGNCPQIREFLIAVYLEPFQIRPAYVWQWTVHALHRVDLVATVGQLSPPTGILLRTEGLLPVGNARRVAIYTNRPQEVIIGTEREAGIKEAADPGEGLSFLLSPRAVYELKLRVHPRKVGFQNYQINAIDTSTQKVIRAWVLCVDVRSPEVSKTFNVELPLLGRQNAAAACHKRITYTNPYPLAKRLTLQTDRPDLVQFKDCSLDVAAGETTEIGLRFIPQQQCGPQIIYVFVKDDEKIEETFSVVTNYS